MPVLGICPSSTGVRLWGPSVWGKHVARSGLQAGKKSCPPLLGMSFRGKVPLAGPVRQCLQLRQGSGHLPGRCNHCYRTLTGPLPKQDIYRYTHTYLHIYTYIVSYTIRYTHFRAGRLRVKPRCMLRYIPKHANFELIKVLIKHEI